MEIEQFHLFNGIFWYVTRPWFQDGDEKLKFAHIWLKNSQKWHLSEDRRACSLKVHVEKLGNQK